MLERVELAVIALALLLFLTLLIGLYRGVRVRQREPDVERLTFNTSSSDWGDPGGLLDFDLGGLDDIIGGIAAVLLWILVAIVLILFLPLVLEGVTYVLFMFVLGLAWIFRRALRQVFIHGPRCRGRFWRSMGRAALFTFLYCGWLIGVLGIAQSLRS